MERFTNKSILVTGGARGIGRAIVEAFTSEGGRVFVADRLAELLDDVRDKNNGHVEVATVDLADFEATKAMARTAIETLGRADARVNCAGAMPPRPRRDVPPDASDH